LYIVFIVLWHVDDGAYMALLNAGDFVADPVPYSDLNATLQAAACAHQGVNVYVPNHCMGGGSYNYSPFFLHLCLWWPPVCCRRRRIGDRWRCARRRSVRVS
jgi:hypothetical protein